MSRVIGYFALVLLLFLLFGCQQKPAVVVPAVSEVVSAPEEGGESAVVTGLATGSPPPVSVTVTNTAVVTIVPTETAVAAASKTPTAKATAIAIATATATATVTPTSDPYAAYSIESLAARSYGGGELEIIERLESNEQFARYLISYPSDGLTVVGFMNVPHEGSEFPVAIVLHGYVSPASYETLAYTTRYADALAEAGYFVIHPNLRGFPPSDEGEDAFRTGLAADVMNLMAIIREQSSDGEGPLRRADPDSLHLWGHSMGGGVVLRVVTVMNEPYLRSAVLYGAMSRDEEQNYEQIMVWSGGNSGEFELAAPDEALQAISPIYHLERIRTPLSIHHGTEDETVPPAWSADLCARLEAIDQPAECFSYNAAPHTFYGAWEELFNGRVIEFFDRY